MYRHIYIYREITREITISRRLREMEWNGEKKLRGGAMRSSYRSISKRNWFLVCIYRFTHRDCQSIARVRSFTWQWESRWIRRERVTDILTWWSKIRQTSRHFLPFREALLDYFAYIALPISTDFQFYVQTRKNWHTNKGSSLPRRYVYSRFIRSPTYLLNDN